MFLYINASNFLTHNLIFRITYKMYIFSRSLKQVYWICVYLKADIWIRNTSLIVMYMLLLLLSRFSRVWLDFVLPHRRSPPGSPVSGILQARTLEWVAISFSNAWKWKMKGKSLSCVGLSDPMDCSSPGFSIHGTFQARILEWGAIAFSKLCT